MYLFLHSPVSQITISIYTTPLVSLFTDEGSDVDVDVDVVDEGSLAASPYFVIVRGGGGGG